LFFQSRLNFHLKAEIEAEKETKRVVEVRPVLLSVVCDCNYLDLPSTPMRRNLKTPHLQMNGQRPDESCFCNVFCGCNCSSINRSYSDCLIGCKKSTRYQVPRTFTNTSFFLGTLTVLYICRVVEGKNKGAERILELMLALNDE
jgi:hypothetical protein